jgi:hypothetical protein
VKVNAFVYGPTREIRLQTAKTGNAGHLGINDTLNQSTGDPRINRIATFLENNRSRFHRLRLGRYDHAVGHDSATSDRSLTRMMMTKLMTPTQCHWV